jgi:hypothetical protein
MFVRKIADFRPPKQPYPCPGIADFRSGKAEPCPGIADLRPDWPKFFGGTQTANRFWHMSKGARLKKLDHIMKRLFMEAVRAC